MLDNLLKLSVLKIVLSSDKCKTLIKKLAGTNEIEILISGFHCCFCNFAEIISFMALLFAWATIVLSLTARSTTQKYEIKISWFQKISKIV